MWNTQASHTAAHAFRSLCNRCSAKLRRPATLLSLIKAAEAVLAPSAQRSPGSQSSPAGTALLSEDRIVIVEGLARIVAVLPPADAAAAGLRLSTPFIQRVQQTATATAGMSSALAAVMPCTAANECHCHNACNRMLRLGQCRSQCCFRHGPSWKPIGYARRLGMCMDSYWIAALAP